ncbi:AI-2E family transporter [Microbacterium sp. MPKO10]|uniref:AI-2E family transporter n=1 Tax=Microbacterium sp. MPKO10 TaxID=2989818 RepID=UPI002235586C|nr:AI-2E family transporter [Microbacterium sp. MPKO10]MCW4457946.1 AI-2E family transporter [Microbacterium sp. MPKO10]
MSESRRPRWWARMFAAPAIERDAVEPEPERHVSSDEIVDTIPPGIRIAAAWSWRLILIAIATAILVFLIVQLRLIVIPVFVAVLLSALVLPFVNFLVGHRWNRGLAVAVAMITAIAAVGALVWLVVWQVGAQAGEVRTRTVESIESFKSFLLHSPLHLTDNKLGVIFDDVWAAIQEDTSTLLSGALSIGSTFGHLAAGILLAMFSLLFILIDGKNIWKWLILFVPRRARAAVDGAGQAGWTTLENYTRTQILVASIDATGIGLGAFFLGLPLAIPIGVLVFLGAFVPIVGAIVTGAVAVFIALVYNGPIIAVIMLGVVLLVQQVEGHILQPLLMGTAVKVHPLGVVLVVTAGSLVAGIPGALFAVPVAAVVNVVIGYISSGAWKDPEATYKVDTIWRTVPAEGRLRRDTSSR